MKISQLKPILYEWAKTYWADANVVWSASKKVKPSSPSVLLSLGAVTRSSQPIIQNVDGVVFYAYPTEVSLQIDLFTQGKRVDIEGETYYENTATSDMLDFVNFVDSLSTIEWSNQKDISIALLSDVQDLSDIVNDSQWQYRAMIELRVTFTQWSAEYYGVLGEESIIFGEDGSPIGIDPSKWEKTASGGGSEKIAVAEVGSFTEAVAEIDFTQEETR